MTDFLTTLQARCSIRKFEQAPVTKQELASVLEAVQCSQSWSNTQCWTLILLEDENIRQQLQQTVPTKNPAFRAITDAGLLIAMCAQKNLAGYFKNEAGSVLGDWYMHDIGIATQNLCNQAHAIGLGTVVVGWLDHNKAQKILELPDDYQLVSLIPLGRPAQKGKSPKRKSISEFVFYDKYGAKKVLP
ncbi:MAG: nitroreductase [Desulfobacteraceae bacterium]|nr:nitroreductase [Desulfobacteraceae bacterium]